MAQNQIDFLKDLEHFQQWLVSTCNVSPKVAKDTKSRVNRIHKNICSQLGQKIATTDGYIELLARIQVYAEKNTTDKTACYSLTGTLRSALKKFTLYKYPELSQSLPSAHGNLIKAVAKSYEF